MYYNHYNHDILTITIAKTINNYNYMIHDGNF